MTAKSENSDSNLKTVKTEKDACTSDSGLTAALNMNGLPQAAWPFLTGSPQANANALLQSYAKLAFPDFDQSNLAQQNNEPQSPSRVPLLPPFAVPSAMFVGGTPSLVPQFGPMPPNSLMQASVSDAGPLLLPPGTQLDPSTLAAITAAAAAYQQMNAGGAMCQFDFPGGARRKNATRETTSTLKAWLHEHRKNPYPTKAEKIMLAILTRMSLTQVSTWFANARRRLKKESKMNSWASSQQQTRGADGGHSTGGKAQQGGADADRADDSDNSVCDDNDNMDFDADSIDIDGECASDGDRPGTCGSGKGQDEDPSAHQDCRQCSSRPNECGIEHADQHRAPPPPPPSAMMTIGLADGGKSGALQLAIRTASNNNNAQAAADKSHKAALSIDTSFTKVQPADNGEIEATLMRHNMFNSKLLLPTGSESRDSHSDASLQQSQSVMEKSKFWSLVDTATSPQQSINLTKAPQPSRQEVASRSAQPDGNGNPDLQSPQVQEFLRNFLAFSAKMQAAVAGGEHAASSGLPSILPPFVAPDFSLPAELLAHGGMPNMQNDPFANAAVLYLNMIKQKGLV